MIVTSSYETKLSCSDCLRTGERHGTIIQLQMILILTLYHNSVTCGLGKATEIIISKYIKMKAGPAEKLYLNNNI